MLSNMVCSTSILSLMSLSIGLQLWRTVFIGADLASFHVDASTERTHDTRRLVDFAKMNVQ
jgi:hypothetical protein